MDIGKKIELIKQVGVEIITEQELEELLQANKNPIAYDGFEPSGTDVHIAQGAMRAININKMTKATPINAAPGFRQPLIVKPIPKAVIPRTNDK